MPTIPLYDPTAQPGQWHRVVAPGGYEWWHVDVVSTTDGPRIRFDLFDGYPFSDFYRRAYARYRRRPTRVTPPLPRDYPRAILVLSGPSAPAETYNAPNHPGIFTATPAGVCVGPAAIRRVEPGSLRLTWGQLPFELTLQSVAQQTDTKRFDCAATSSVHFWHVLGTECDVTGVVRGVAFHGRGQHDHLMGTGPISAELREAVRQALGDY